MNISMLKKKNKISEIFNIKDNYTFLIGAGVSMESPSNLPSAREFVKAIIELCAPEEYINLILSQKSLRYEVLVENIKNNDPELEFLDYFDNIISPNLIHMFIAQLIINGKGRHHIITTNFDYLMEFAFLNLIGTNEKEKIIPIITKSDFSTFENKNDINIKGKYPICKIHGSKKNIITQSDTSESLITDITSLGKNRAEGETFGIEPYKKLLVNNLLVGQTLVIMGYSGGDDFDIIPMLRGFREIKKIIWIEHSSSQKPEIFHNIKNQDAKKKKNDYSDVGQLLAELSKNWGFDNYIIKINTLQLVEEYLADLFLNGKLKDKSNLKNQNSINLKNWLENCAAYRNIPIYNKYYFAGNLLYYLGEVEKGLLCYKKGLKSTPESNQILRSLFITQIGIIYYGKGNYEIALKNYEEALKIADEIGDLNVKATNLSSIGMIYYVKRDYENALKNYQEALGICEQRGDLNGKAANLTNIGGVHYELGDYLKALKNFDESLKIHDKFGDLAKKAVDLVNIGGIHDAIKNYEEALNHFFEALKIDEQIGSPSGIANDLTNIGSIYDSTGNYNYSLNFYHSALKIHEEIGDLQGKATDFNNIAHVYYLVEDDANALKYLELTLETYKELKLPYNIKKTQDNIDLLKKNI